MTIDFWETESQVYPAVDVAGVSGRSKVEKRYTLGNFHEVNFKVHRFDKTPISLFQEVNPDKVGFSANFRLSNGVWFRVDNNHDGTHYHLTSGNQAFGKPIPVPSHVTSSVSGLISWSFEKAAEIANWKNPAALQSGSGFVGFVL